MSMTIKRILHISFFLILVIACLLLIINREYSVDDLYIHFTYIDNMLDGKGLVWSVGQYVEGFTTFLGVILLAVPRWFGLDALSCVRVLNLIFLLISLLIFSKGKLNAFEDKAILRVATLFAFANFDIWILAGIDSGLTSTLLLGLAALGLSTNLQFKHYVGVGVLAALSFLARHDSVLVWAPFLLLLIFESKNKFSNLMLIITPFVMLVLPFLLFRFSYYGDVLPNTFYVRMVGLNDLFFTHGLSYLLGSLRHVPLFWFLIIVNLISWFFVKVKNKEKALLVGILFYVFYLGKVGGDWMPYDRMYVYLIPVLILTSSNVFEKILEDIKLLVVFSLLLVVNLNLYGWTFIGDEKHFTSWNLMSLSINREWKKGDRVALIAAGYLTYKTRERGFEYIDMLGLRDKKIAKMKMEHWAVAKHDVAHMKGDGEYVLSLKPDKIIFSEGYIKINCGSFKDCEKLNTKETILRYLENNNEYVSQIDLMKNEVFKRQYELKHKMFYHGKKDRLNYDGTLFYFFEKMRVL